MRTGLWHRTRGMFEYAGNRIVTREIVTLENSRLNGVIKCIKLIQNVDNSFFLYTKSYPNFEGANAFRAEIMSSTLPYSDYTNQCNIVSDHFYLAEGYIYYSSLYFNGVDDPEFQKVMTLITNLEPSFAGERKKDEIIQLINHHANLHQPAPNRARSTREILSGRWSSNADYLKAANTQEREKHEIEFDTSSVIFFLPKPGLPLPGIFAPLRSTQSSLTAIVSANAKTLSKLENFTMADIPDHFCCPLSLTIMDDPVIDPAMLNEEAKKWVAATESEKVNLSKGNYDEVDRFDRASLIKVLSENNGKNPVTTQPLTVYSLVSDTQRKSDIATYMQEQISNFASKTLLPTR